MCDEIRHKNFGWDSEHSADIPKDERPKKNKKPREELELQRHNAQVTVRLYEKYRHQN